LITTRLKAKDKMKTAHILPQSTVLIFAKKFTYPLAINSQDISKLYVTKPVFLF